jgi:histidinol phosphatase-like enzyme
MKESLRSREYTQINEETMKFWRQKLKEVKIILFDWDGTLNNDSLKQFVAKKDLIQKFN